MSHDYWTCPVCNSNNDFGEKCDCGEPERELPFVAVPNDYGTHSDLYKEELSVNIIKVRFLKDGQPSGRAYTYFSEKPIEVGDKVQINDQAVGVVTEIDVPEEEIADYRDKCKFIHGPYEEPTKNGEGIDLLCDGCTHNDLETGMCASHEGCIREDDKREDLR